MPVTKSAKKALRQSACRRVQNLQRKQSYKTVSKEVRNLAAEGKSKEAQAALPRLYKTLDKAAKSGLIKKNKASRLKSRLTKLVFAKKA